MWKSSFVVLLWICALGVYLHLYSSANCYHNYRPWFLLLIGLFLHLLFLSAYFGPHQQECLIVPVLWEYFLQQMLDCSHSLASWLAIS